MKRLASIRLRVSSFMSNTQTAAALFSLVAFTCLGSQTALAALADDFVTTWKTDNLGTSDDTSITVPMVGGPYDVDWDNDGTFDEFGLSGSATHDYGVTETVTIRIQGAYDSIRFFNGGDRLKILSIDQWGTNSWVSMNASFFGAENLQVPAIDNPDFSAVTSMVRMFRDATLANPNTSGWDTSAVTNINSMFRGASAANPDTSNWDVSMVSNMFAMFLFATSANPDTSGWKTANVLTMESMFNGATSANPDTSGWDTSALVKMDSMFQDATSANPDTSGWSTSAVTDMDSMFAGAASANPDVSGWDTSAVTTMESMFSDATSFDQDIGSWDVSALLYASGMFAGAALSTANYESLLIGWDAQALQPGVSFSGGNSLYCSEAAISARANMITSDTWTISDGGQACLPSNPIVAPDLTPETDTGVSDNDNFTTDNMPDFYVECLIISDTVTLYTDYPIADQSVGTHVCSSVGTEVSSVSTALMAGVHNMTYTYTNLDGESGHSPSLAVTVDLIFAGGFE